MEIASAFECPDGIFTVPQRIIASHYVFSLEYFNKVLSDCESDMWNFEQMKPELSLSQLTIEISTLRSLMSETNAWRRRLFFYAEDMQWNLEALGITGDQQGINNKIDGATREDFRRLTERMQGCKSRVESIMPVVIGAFSLLEAQRSLVEARYVTKLTKLALVFVPLSFTTGLFSMAEDFAPGSSLFWIPWVVAIPIIILMFAFIYASQSGPVHAMLRSTGRLTGC